MRLSDWYNVTIYNTVWWYITLSVSTKHYMRMSNILSMSITVLKLMIICHYKTIIEPNQLKVSDSIYMPSFNATIYYTIMKQGRVLCSMQGGILLSSAATKNPTEISRKNPAFSYEWPTWKDIFDMRRINSYLTLSGMGCQTNA